MPSSDATLRAILSRLTSTTAIILAEAEPADRITVLHDITATMLSLACLFLEREVGAKDAAMMLYMQADKMCDKVKPS